MGELKPGWKRWRFDQIAHSVTDRVDDPKKAGVEYYIGLEHLDSESLKIRRWGSPDDVSATKLLFEPGDIIFGRRRAYQRKVGIAEFRGIASAHALVLRAKPSVVLPEFLPFFMQSDVFMERAVKISVGGLSPTINWKTLAKQEFALPPLEEQRRIAGLLQKTGTVTDAARDLFDVASKLFESTLLHLFPVHGLQTKPLSDWCQSLITYGIVQAGPHVDNGIPYIRVSDMTAGPELTLEGMLRTAPEVAAKYARSRVSGGDIVVALRGPVGLPKVVPQVLDGANLTQGTARVSVNAESPLRDYVYWALQAPSTRRVMRSYAKGSTFSELTLAALRAIPIPERPIQQVRRINSVMAEANRAVQASRERLRAAEKQLIAQRETVLRGAR